MFEPRLVVIGREGSPPRGVLGLGRVGVAAHQPSAWVDLLIVAYANRLIPIWKEIVVLLVILRMWRLHCPNEDISVLRAACCAEPQQPMYRE